KEKNYRLVTIEELESLLSSDYPQGYLAVDTETDSLDPIRAQLLGVSLSWKPFEAYYISLAEQNGRATSKDILAKVKTVLEPLFSDSSLVKCGSNLKYDYRILSHHGIKLKGPFFDT